ncbi:hypothetical protein [Desulfonatronum thioautotrophicum]|uniref:hypothetical protein n=1 Tax=Desulfonatronum thioautotrophicum TaxID=617001 RepID=UPI0005EB218E|nr:hypothetical protein [Desulfonatronum thioautotrophicum]
MLVDRSHAGAWERSAAIIEIEIDIEIGKLPEIDCDHDFDFDHDSGRPKCENKNILGLDR